MVRWDAFDNADDAYDQIRKTVGTRGIPLSRECIANKQKDCVCQGSEEEYKGGSFTFGCSYSERWDGCKFGHGNPDRFIDRFRLVEGTDPMEKQVVAEIVHRLADTFSPFVQKYAPDSYRNMMGACCLYIYTAYHGLPTPNEGINKRNLKIWAVVADKICFGHT